eukprot:COSAG01_NODE_8176_length_2890_cov_24.337513_5_plen_163_part_00
MLCAWYLRRLGGVPAAGSFHGDEEVAVSSVLLTESGPMSTYFTLTPGADYDSDRAIRSEYAFPAVANFADARQARSMPWYSQPTWPQVPRCHGDVPLVLARPTETHHDGGRRNDAPAVVPVLVLRGAPDLVSAHLVGMLAHPLHYDAPCPPSTSHGASITLQ